MKPAERNSSKIAVQQAFFAHSIEGQEKAAWQPLCQHLTEVARLASEFAEPFAASAVASAAGLLHDLGKYTHEFQNRLNGSQERVDHSTWGAKLALERFGQSGYLIAYAIAGHHAGLANGSSEGSRTSLQQRLAAILPALQSEWEKELDLPDKLQLPLEIKPRQPQRVEHQVFTATLLVRMLFSCLVDADYLDTESFYARADGRQYSRSTAVSIAALQRTLSAHLNNLGDQARPSAINEERRRILGHVREQAKLPPGLFSLTVPTGGGKTLTSLAFGLDHAVQHGLRRLIYVIPFTSIVEQTARVFREALGPMGDDGVLEHHSAFNDDPQQAKEARDKVRLAMENWDRPIVVTTAVQFFESLFADRPAQCRKLHRIAGSVIVLDEAQTLPLHLLRPTLLALDELARNYGCTIIFCTATQPALSDARFQDVIGAMRELAPEPAKLFDTFRRVTVRHVGALNDDQVVECLAERQQALCIVNNRLHARALYEALARKDGTVHLSTLMCARHRSEVLANVRHALKRGEPCRVISTSLIEAGVDISFPFVMRAEAGLDSIAQAAGRCNREGLWSSESSEVQVFCPDNQKWKPPKELEQFAAVAATVLRQHACDPLSPVAIQHYFEELYWARGSSALDEHDLFGLLRAAQIQSLPFEKMARLYRLIDTSQASVIVPYDEEARHVIKQLEFAEGVRSLARQLQTCAVQVPRKAFDQLRDSGAVQPACSLRWGEQFMVLSNESLYSAQYGLFWEDPSFIKSTQLVL